MRFVEFVEVRISQTEDGRLQVTKGPRFVEAGSISSVVPGMVPSEVMGPGNQPVANPAAFLCLAGEHVLVDHTIDEVLYKLTWESIVVEGPEDDSENEFQVTKTVKRPVSEIEPGNESKIII